MVSSSFFVLPRSSQQLYYVFSIGIRSFSDGWIYFFKPLFIWYGETFSIVARAFG